MSSINLDYLTPEFPEESGTIQRLEGFLDSKSRSKNSQQLVFSLTRLFDIAIPSSMLGFSAIINRLVETGVLVRIFRVESESRGGIGDFESIQAIPSSIHDWRRDIDVIVSSENIRLYYKIKDSSMQ
ncbi:hypothetical protein [Ferribacterium limneticum]|uniref:hypothetical protein n=1 Tax=Ferribacterium limneticum TaxID=76259 RepID=UPI001CFB8495|nr:hypothetical protein [Ferribacterium limneticum]UCV28411.1 hypothetical protein KI617_19585 [Ferribacterium limneticum]UCV32328.1 hypothetical protein KI608_19585 [Ferribacterium limneticum]